jgi:hypothetical protein
MAGDKNEVRTLTLSNTIFHMEYECEIIKGDFCSN